MTDPIAHAASQRSTAKLTKPEVAFIKVLEQRVRDGEVIWWCEHPLSLRLANGSRYSPDFMAVLRDGTIVVYEVKGTGGWRHTTFAGRGRPAGSEGGKSRAKFLFAVECFPLFRFVAAFQRLKRDGGGFDETVHAPRLGYGAASLLQAMGEGSSCSSPAEPVAAPEQGDPAQ